jgi:hypothetical protein
MSGTVRNTADENIFSNPLVEPQSLGTPALRSDCHRGCHAAKPRAECGPSFDVVSIRENKAGGMPQSGPTADGCILLMKD